MYFNELGGGKRRFEVEISKVDGPKEGIGRDNRVKEDVDTGEGGDTNGGRDKRLETVDIRVEGAVRAG